MNAKALVAAARSGIGRVANGALSGFGLHFSRISLDCSAADADTPLEAHYRANAKEFLWNAPLSQCRILHSAAFPCARNAGNPFVDALVQHEHSRNAANAEKLLSSYYERFRPQSAAEALGLLPGIATSLDQAPALAFVFPWSAFSPSVARQRWLSGSYFDMMRAFSLPSGEGWKAWGPLSSKLVELEFRRLTSVSRSIKQSGYRRSNGPDGDIGGVLLIDGDDFSVQVSPGHHRAAALAALGYERVPIRIAGPLVRRADVMSWPNVVNGVFPPRAALQVFDRMIAGRPPWSGNEHLGR